MIMRKNILITKDQIKTPVPVPACSVVYDNNVIGRNLDWLYSEMADCIIRTDNTIGVAGANPEFTKQFAESQVYDESIYKLLPFFLQDGINRTGLCVSTLVCPHLTSKSKPTTVKDSVCSIMLCRYLLDNYETARQAHDALMDKVEVYFPRQLIAMGYNQHWVIADKNNCYLFEVDPFGSPIMMEYTGRKLVVTNFQHNNVNFNSDGTVYTPATQDTTHDAIITNQIHPQGSGLERYNLLLATSAYNVSTMKAALKQVAYSKSYTQPSHRWYTEFVDEELGLTCVSKPADFDPHVMEYEEHYKDRSRDEDDKYYGYWNTNHSCVYNLNDGSMSVCSQENFNNWHEN